MAASLKVVLFRGAGGHNPLAPRLILAKERIVATLEQIRQQRDKTSAAIDAWSAAADVAAQDATQAASAGALADTAREKAAASQALADEKQASAKAEAQALADLFAEAPPPT